MNTTPSPWKAHGTVVRSHDGHFICKARSQTIRGDTYDPVERGAELIARAT